MTDARRVAVVGAGISGLSAAHHLLRAGAGVTVFEASEAVGGRIGNAEVDGLTLPTAPDAFLARLPQMIDLANDVGLGDDLIAPVAREARIFRDGQLHPLPPNLLGIPTDPEGLASSGLLSPAAAERALFDLTAADDRPDGDESVGALVRRRLGDEVLEWIVDPLLGGINAGDSDRLSALSGVPQIGAARALDSSLIEAVRTMRSRTVTDPDAPIFLTPRAGLSALVDALADEVAAEGALHLGTRVHIESDGGRWRVGGEVFDRVITATPALPTAHLVRPFAPTAADELEQIESSSVALILLVLDPGSVPLDPTISGVLVPRLAGHFVTAISVATHKWPHLVDDGRVVLRVSVGRRTDDRWHSMDDAAIVDAVRSDLARIVGVTATPRATHVTRWADSLPQYDVGHADRVDRIEAAIAVEAPGIHLAGPMLRGLGLPACAGSGRAAAEAALG